jgi:hypothetical protein
VAGTDSPRVVVGPSVPLALRGLGVSAAGLGLVVLAFIGAGALLEGGARTFVMIILAALSVPLVLGVLTGLLRMLGRGARFVHGPDGFENRTAWVGRGRRRGTWPEVTGLREMRDVLVIDMGESRSLVDCRVLGRTPGSLGEEIRPYVGRPLR